MTNRVDETFLAAKEEVQKEIEIEPTAAEPATYAPQQAVVIRGLGARTELNGEVAEVLGATYSGRYPVKVVQSGECIRVKPDNLTRTDRHPQEGKVIDGRVMRYGEWFDIQTLLNHTMNDGEEAGDAFAALEAHEQADVLAGRRAMDRPSESGIDGLGEGCSPSEWLGESLPVGAT